jgi:hypothetical protein
MKALLPFVLALPLLLTACGADNSKSSQISQLEQAPGIEQTSDKNLSMGMNLDLSKLQSSGVAADKIIVTITKGEFAQTIEAAHVDYVASVEFSNLVVGEYSIAVKIFDGEDLVAEGTGLGTVSANQVAIVNMNLELLSGGLVVNVNIPAPIEGEYEVLTIEKTIVTTTEKLDGGPIEATGVFGTILADAYVNATYDHEAAYTQLESGSEIKVNFGISYNVSNTDEFEIVPDGLNTLAVTYNELTVIACTECDSDIQKSADTLTISYKNVILPEDIIASLGDRNSGDPVEILAPAVLAQRMNVGITFKKVDGSDLPEGNIRSEALLDDSEYQVQFELEGEACIVSPVEGCAGLGTVSAK